MIPPKVADVRDEIKTWLIQENLFKEEVVNESLHFQIAAEFPARSSRYLSIIQPKDHEDMIVVFSRIVLAEVHQKAIMTLLPQEKEKLMWQIRYDLLFRQSNFEIEPGGMDMQSIRFMREIYYDGLSKDRLMEAIRENFKCELYVVWKFQEMFGEGSAVKVSKPPEPMYI